jgi:alpha-L-arabinofuranosidase
VKGTTLTLLAALLSVLQVALRSRAEPVIIDVKADRVLHPASRNLTGSCIEDVNHEIYGGIYSQMIFGESFQEPAEAPLITGFRAYGGMWVVRDGAIQINGEAGPKLISEHAAFADGVVHAEILFPDQKGRLGGLLVRVGKPGVGADKFFGYEISLDPAAQRLRLARHRNNYEPIEDVPCAVAVGRWIPVEIRLEGPVMEILVDGKPVLNHNDGENTIRSGTIALRPWHRQVAYRQLSIETGGQVDALPLSQAQVPPDVSKMWRAVARGTAVGRFAIVKEHPFTGTQSQQMTLESGEGEVGIENQGLNRWGMNFVAGKPYEGYVWVRAQKPETVSAQLESRDGARVYASQRMEIPAGDWQRLEIALKASADDPQGRFALMLTQPGSVTIGHVFLQPGEWGRFKGLPVRRDVAEALVQQGITVLRYGGSMVNHPAYRWKNMIGPRERRPPTAGTWYRYSSNGWGIPDFMAFCEAAGFEYIPAFNMGETAQDMADFIDYAKAPADSEWGRKRAADGHAAPYQLKYMELGNEERVDENYAARFESLAAAIWAKDPKMILVVGDFSYRRTINDPLNFTGAASHITTLAGHQRILKFARQHDAQVWFDVHVDTDHPRATNDSLDGMFSFNDAIKKIADGARCKVVVFEFNSGNHAQKRALANVLAIHAIERDGRIPIVTCANGLQPDKQNDNGWDQGLLFLNPSQVWLQPPGYAAQMLSSNHMPLLVQSDVSGAQGQFDVNAKRSIDGKTLVLEVVNPSQMPIRATIRISGFAPSKPEARVTELAGPLDAANTAGSVGTIVPRVSQWKHGMIDGDAEYIYAPYSVTVLRLE